MDITVVSKDGKEFTLEYENASKSETIKDAYLRSDDNAKIPFPYVNGDTLFHVVNYLN